MSTNAIMKEWIGNIEVGKRFVVNVKMYRGRTKNIRYTRLYFSKPKQFKRWLSDNKDQLIEVLDVKPSHIWAQEIRAKAQQLKGD